MTENLVPNGEQQQRFTKWIVLASDRRSGIKSIPSFRWGPSSPPQRGTDPQFSAHRHMLWPSGWMDQTTLARYEAL